MDAQRKRDDGWTVKAVLWQRRGLCRIYVSLIAPWGRETGCGSFELVAGKWTATGDAKETARSAWGTAQAMLDALGFVNGQPPSAYRRYEGPVEWINPNAEPGSPGHIAG